MASLPSGIRSVLEDLSEEFAATDWHRFRVLIFAAILCVGRHTVCRLLQVTGTQVEGHWSSDHRVLSTNLTHLGF
ncbi:MAG: hypothetical protein ACK5Q5_09005 [Planctomycetaceae bacterium]